MEQGLSSACSSLTQGTANTLSVAIFARDEAERIGPCLQALAAAHAHAPAWPEGLPGVHVTVLLNGSRDDSERRAAAALIKTGLPGRIYVIGHGDKANAINQFLHRLRPPAETYIFIDGYAAVCADALGLLSRCLAAQPMAHAAAAVPSTGRSAATVRRNMLAHPGLNGSLFALRGCFVERLVADGLRLPLGLYRGDGLLGSMVMHDLDAVSGGWLTHRLAIEPRASWQAPQWKPWRWRDVSRHFHRMVRQGRSRLEWAALREIIYRDGFAALPEDANAMALDWLARDPAAREPRLWRDPFAAMALREMRHATPPAPETLLPRIVLRTPSR